MHFDGMVIKSIQKDPYTEAPEQVAAGDGTVLVFR